MTKLENIKLGTEVFLDKDKGKGTVLAYGTPDLILIGYKSQVSILTWPIHEGLPLIWEEILTESFIPLDKIKKEYKFGFWFDKNKEVIIAEELYKAPIKSESTLTINADKIFLNADQILINGVDYIYSDFKTNTSINQNSLLKEEVRDAIYRVAANQITKGIKASIISLMQKSGSLNITALSDLLDTNLGEAFTSAFTGYMLTYIFKDDRMSKLAEELRISGFTSIGNDVFESIVQTITPVIIDTIQETSKENVRIDLKEEQAQEPETLEEALKQMNKEIT